MQLRTGPVLHRRTILMNPGPVLVDERVRKALNWPDMCHREPEFSELMTRVREKVTQLCGGDETYTTVMFTGSGTAALEATLSSVAPPDGKVLIVDNGHYGERLAKIVAVHNIPYRVSQHGWGVPFDLEALDKTLQSDPSITHVGIVHHETSTGMLNPLHEVGAIVARHRRSLLADAISSLGGEILDVQADHIDWCIGTANKCIEGVPGISFVCAPRIKLDGLANIPPRTFYLNLYTQYVAEDRDEAPPFTPAVQVLFAFDQALDLMLAEKVEGRHARYRALAEQLRSGLKELGFGLFLPPEHRSSLLTTVYLPDGVNYGDLHDRLKAQGFVIYAGQDALSQRVFRLANMGQITADDIKRFLEVLGPIALELRSKGQRSDERYHPGGGSR